MSIQYPCVFRGWWQVPTFLSAVASDKLCDFAIALASAARIFTASQLARHPELSWRTQPERAARECLNSHPTFFERLPGPYGEPFRWRLTGAAKRRLGVQQAPVTGITQRSHHWLGVGDIWLTLTFAGGRPGEWRTEWERQFDVYCMWQGKPYLIEYQRTPITTFKWQQKWHKRIEWYKQQQWAERPRVVLVNTTGQTDETISAPKGTIHVKKVDDLPKVLRPPQKM